MFDNCLARRATLVTVAYIAANLVCGVATAQVSATQMEGIFSNNWSSKAPDVPDSAALHAKVLGQPRNGAWADATEEIIRSEIAQALTYKGDTSSLRATCKSSICEVAATFAVDPRNPKKATTDANQLIEQFGLATSRAASRMQPGARRTDLLITADPDSNRIGLLAYLEEPA